MKIFLNWWNFMNSSFKKLGVEACLLKWSSWLNPCHIAGSAARYNSAAALSAAERYSCSGVPRAAAARCSSSVPLTASLLGSSPARCSLPHCNSNSLHSIWALLHIQTQKKQQILTSHQLYALLCKINLLLTS